MPIEFEGCLFLREINGAEEGPYALFLDPDNQTGIDSRDQLRFEYPLTDIDVLVESVPERGRYTGARHQVRLVLDPIEEVGGTDVGPRTARADTRVSVEEYDGDDYVLRIRDPDDSTWSGDALVGWNLPEVLDTNAEYDALLEVTYDHEASRATFDDDEIERKRKEDGEYLEILR